MTTLMMRRRREWEWNSPLQLIWLGCKWYCFFYIVGCFCCFAIFSSAAISKYSRYDNFRFLPLFGYNSIFTYIHLESQKNCYCQSSCLVCLIWMLLVKESTRETEASESKLQKKTTKKTHRTSHFHTFIHTKQWLSSIWNGCAKSH